MKQVALELVNKGANATLYTITFAGEDMSEFSKFIEKFKGHATLQRDYQIILFAINKIMEFGALERYFRNEGKMNDGVCALPLESGRLRLYCLRISDKILIAGNGDIKNTRTYNESEKLKGYVIDLQLFDKILKLAVKKGSVTIEETEIVCDNNYFEI